MSSSSHCPLCGTEIVQGSCQNKDCENCTMKLDKEVPEKKFWEVAVPVRGLEIRLVEAGTKEEAQLKGFNGDYVRVLEFDKSETIATSSAECEAEESDETDEANDED